MIPIPRKNRTEQPEQAQIRPLPEGQSNQGPFLMHYPLWKATWANFRVYISLFSCVRIPRISTVAWNLCMNWFTYEMVSTLKAPTTTVAENNFTFIFFREQSPDIPCESLAKQSLHMKYQDPRFPKNKYSRLSLSRIPMDSLKYFAISVPWHIRIAELRKK